MSNSTNLVVISGFLGNDAEVKGKVATTSIALAESYKDKETGKFKEIVNWVNLVAFGQQAENFAKHAHKGTYMQIQGSLKTGSYEDKETGKTIYTSQIEVDKFQVLNIAKSAK